MRAGGLVGNAIYPLNNCYRLSRSLVPNSYAKALSVFIRTQDSQLWVTQIAIHRSMIRAIICLNVTRVCVELCDSK